MAAAIKNPGRGHRATVFLFAEMASKEVPLRHVAKTAGISVDCLWKWKKGSRAAGLHLVEAALNVLGYELCARPIGSGRDTEPGDPEQEG